MAIGAIATALAFVFIYKQTKSIKAQTRAIEEDMKQSKRQTELLEQEMNYRLRPWLYPTDKGKLNIKEWKEESKKGLDVKFYLCFKNEGGLPAKSLNAQVTFRTMLKGAKDSTSHYPGHAVFSQREFLVEGVAFFNDLEIEDRTRYTKFSLPILITVRLEYEYGAQSDVRKGFYEGRFQIKEL
jgi:hypothetical protein